MNKPRIRQKTLDRLNCWIRSRMANFFDNDEGAKLTVELGLCMFKMELWSIMAPSFTTSRVFAGQPIRNEFVRSIHSSVELIQEQSNFAGHANSIPE